MFSQWFVQKDKKKNVGFEDVLYAIKNHCILINVLPPNEQSCLIYGTLAFEDEEKEINELLKNNDLLKYRAKPVFQYHAIRN